MSFPLPLTKLNSALFRAQRRAQDRRTRRNRIELQNKGFNMQMEDLVNAYMDWSMKSGGFTAGCTGPAGLEGGELKILVVDVFGKLPWSISMWVVLIIL